MNPTVSDGFRRYPTVSDGIKVPRDGIRRYPTVFDGIRRYPTVPWFSPRRYPTVAGFPPAGNPTAGFLSAGILAACLHSLERLGTDCLPGQDGLHATYASRQPPMELLNILPHHWSQNLLKHIQCCGFTNWSQSYMGGDDHYENMVLP